MGIAKSLEDTLLNLDFRVQDRPRGNAELTVHG